MTDVVSPANSPPQTFGGQYGGVQPSPSLGGNGAPPSDADLSDPAMNPLASAGQSGGAATGKVVAAASSLFSKETMFLIFLFLIAAIFIALGGYGVMQSQNTIKRVAGGIVA